MYSYQKGRLPSAMTVCPYIAIYKTDISFFTIRASREAHKLKRATESKALAEIEVERETAIATAEETAEHSDVETDDELTDPAVEYQAWRLRELLRIKEDEHNREKMFGERETQEKIRRMSEDEKKAYFEANPDKKRETPGTCGDASKQAIDTPKPGFLQKYYHKGAFFQEASDDQFGTAETHEIYKRDFSGTSPLFPNPRTVLSLSW